MDAAEKTHPPTYAAEPYVGSAPPMVIIQQQAPAVVEQPSEPERYQLPYTALTLSIVFIVIFSLLLWIPGFLFTLPALAFSIAGTQTWKGRRVLAKSFSIVSITLVVLGVVMYPLIIYSIILGLFCGPLRQC